MKIPKDAKLIISELEKAGHEAYVVGGCVRDMLLGRTPEDWDITTSAKPEEVKAVFSRTIDTGIEHGTVTVMLGKIGYEVTTYRMDGDYADHRHPNEVIFTPSLEEDLKRRDFTINAMAYSEDRGLVDLFGGEQDLEKKIIRCVGDPVERFDEDALRMLRGIRFAGQLGFDIEKNTLAAISEKSETIKNISAERIQTELAKLIVSDGAGMLRVAVDTGLTRHFLPELDAMYATPQNNPHHLYDVGEHTIHVIENVNRNLSKEHFEEISNKYLLENKLINDKEKIKEKDKENSYKKIHTVLCYAALLHDAGKPKCKRTDEMGIDHFHGHDVKGEKIANDVLRRLKLDNDTRKLAKTLVRWHDMRYEQLLNDSGEYTKAGKNSMRRLMANVGVDMMPYLFILQRADILAQSEYRRDKKLAALDAGERCYEEIRAAGDAISISDLAITGKDLIDEKGYATGPAIGAELKRLMELVLDGPELNTKEKLLELAEKRS